MSTWKLVEAEAIIPVTIDENKSSKSKGSQQSNNNHNNNNNNHHHSQSSNSHEKHERSNNGRRHSRERRRSGQGRKNKDQESIESRQYYAHLAVQTLEYYFAPDSLISDTTIRSYLDEAGYIPIAFVCNFPEILAIGAFYEDIVAALQKSTLFEVDVENETMRLHDWQKWLMPNGLGGFGLPRYIKQTANYEYYENAAGEWATNEGNSTNQQEVEIPPREQELSPTATEYTPPNPKGASNTSSPSSSTTPTSPKTTTTTTEGATNNETTTENATEASTTKTSTTDN